MLAMKIFFSLLFVACAHLVTAQVNYKDISFGAALQLAKVNGKLIFLQFESADCDECNEVAEKGLSDKEVVSRIDEAFIPVKISARNADREQIAMLYNLPGTGF